MSFKIELDPPMPYPRWAYNIEKVERLLLEAAVKAVGDNPNRIAWYLGVTVPTVRVRLEKYRIKRK